LLRDESGGSLYERDCTTAIYDLLAENRQTGEWKQGDK
jgi:hypothetical protein